MFLLLALWSEPVAEPPAPSKPDAKRFRLRTGSLEVGLGWRAEFYPDIPGPSVCSYNIACGFTPRVGFDFEFGSRAARLVVGSFTAPIPFISGDVIVLEPFIVEVGGLFGGPKIRAGVMLNGGAINGGAAAVLRVSPWVDRFGHRHGFDLRVSTSVWLPLGLAITYRWYPRKLDRRG
jgi:hypothetical protein